MEDAPLSVIKKIADLQAKEQYQVDKGPLYKSAPSTQNGDPKKLSDEVWFEGTITAASNTCQLAIFSDDGCDVWIDGVLVLNNFAKGQHLPDLKQSLHVLDKFKPVAGRGYQVKIHYANTIYQGKTDIDGCTLFAFAGGADAEMPHMLDIYYPQNGAQVPNKDKFTIGSFTVVNINSTDGAAKIDAKGNVEMDLPDQDKPKVLVAQAAILSGATKGKTTLSVDKMANLNRDFPAFVYNIIGDQSKKRDKYSAPNRIRVTDDSLKTGHNGELAYIESIDGKANTIKLTAPLHDSYDPKQGARIEIGEVDLMKLVIHAPPKMKENAVTLRPVKGNAKLWESENKGKEFALTKGKGVGLEAQIPVKDLPKALWIESRVKSAKSTDVVRELKAQGIRGIVIMAEAGKEMDMVAATGVWAIRTLFVNSGDELQGNPQGVVKDTFKNNFAKSLGMGYFPANFPEKNLFLGGRMQSEFTLFPPGIGKEPAVIADASRQAATVYYLVQRGYMEKITAPVKDLPQIGWNRSEVGTDDDESRPENLEDNSKTDDHVYNTDYPSLGPIREDEKEGGIDYYIRRFNAYDFVRFKFGPSEKFSTKGIAVEGSRGSFRRPWHHLLYARRGNGVLKDQKAARFVKENVIMGKIENPQAYVPDLNTYTASVLQLINYQIKDKDGKMKDGFGPAKGNGSMTVPSVKNKTLYAEGTTLGWEAKYQANDRWQLDVLQTMKGRLVTIQSPIFDINKDKKTWTLRAYSADKTRLIEVIVTKGSQDFGEGDIFRFSTFRSADKGNGINVDLIDPDVEEAQFESQQK